MSTAASRAQPLAERADWKQLRCSFCDRDADHVRFLCSGVAGGMICDRCCIKAFVIFLRAHITSLLRPAAA
jgi:hypothetical protein